MAKWVCWCPAVDPWPDMPVLGMVINEIFIGIHRSMMFGFRLWMDGWMNGWQYPMLSTYIYIYTYFTLFPIISATHLLRLFLNSPLLLVKCPRNVAQQGPTCRMSAAVVEGRFLMVLHDLEDIIHL
jgi:hypothetical protein